MTHHLISTTRSNIYIVSKNAQVFIFQNSNMLVTSRFQISDFCWRVNHLIRLTQLVATKSVFLFQFAQQPPPPPPPAPLLGNLVPYIQNVPRDGRQYNDRSSSTLPWVGINAFNLLAPEFGI